MDSTGEILKSGAFTNITDLLKKLAGPAFEECGAILADNVRVYRVKNLLKTTEKTRRILEDAGVQPQAVPSRLLLPILDACSVEDNDDLQERWAGLLAAASQNSDSLSPSFIETLKQLTPSEAKHWDHIYVEMSKLHKKEPTASDSIPIQAFTSAWAAPDGALETYERLGLMRRDYRVKLETGPWMATFDPEDQGKLVSTMESVLGDIEDALDSLDAEVEYRLLFTAYALRFINACQGSRKTQEFTFAD